MKQIYYDDSLSRKSSQADHKESLTQLKNQQRKLKAKSHGLEIRCQLLQLIKSNQILLNQSLYKYLLTQTYGFWYIKTI